MFGSWDSKDRSGPLTILPAPARPVTGVTPESIRATSIPSPVTEDPVDQPLHALVARVALAMLSIELPSRVGSYAGVNACSATGASSVTASTPSVPRSPAAASAGSRTTAAPMPPSRRSTTPPRSRTRRSTGPIDPSPTRSTNVRWLT